MSKPKRKKDDLSDNSDDEASRPLCQFGAKCYRKNPDHLRQYRHPPTSPAAKATLALSQKRSKTDTPPHTRPSPSTAATTAAPPAAAAAAASSSHQRSSSTIDSDSSLLKSSSSLGAGQWVAAGDDDDAVPTSSLPSLPPCRFGVNCYRKNLLHFSEYSHPTVGRSNSPSASSSSAATSSRSPPSTHNRKPAAVASSSSSNDRSSTSRSANGSSSNLLHNNNGSSSSAANSNSSSSSNNGTEEKKRTKSGSSSNGGNDDDDDNLSPALKLTRSYSSMSEDERKQLILQAWMEKEKLQREVEQQKKAVEQHKAIADELKQRAGRPPMLDGEQDAMNAGIIKYFPLMAVRSHSGGAEETHFRLAESQFYRLLEGGAGFKVTAVEYVVSPSLVKLFQAAKADLEKNGLGEAVLAFHGTKEDNIASICETGFRVPKKDKDFKQQTDSGWYGAGVYFSEYPQYSMDYIQGKSKLLLCQVLPGRSYRCTKLIHGEDVKDGYDSHTSPDGKELVIFNASHILPSYVVHFAQTDGDYKYDATRTLLVTKPVRGVVASTTSSAVAAAQMKENVARHTKMAKQNATNMYKEANDIPDNGVSVLTDLTFASVGKLACKQAELKSLIGIHGGTWSASGSGATHFIISEAEAKKKTTTAKVTKAVKAGVPILSQQWLFAAIITSQLPEIEPFTLIRAAAAATAAASNDDDDNEEDEEEEDE